MHASDLHLPLSHPLFDLSTDSFAQRVPSTLLYLARITLTAISSPHVCLFSWHYNPSGCIFHSPVAGFSLLIQGFLITHDMPQTVRLLWTSDQSVAETSTWQYTTLTTCKHPCPGGIRTHNLSGWAAVDLRLRSRGHWDWLISTLQDIILFTNVLLIIFYTYIFLSLQDTDTLHISYIKHSIYTWINKKNYLYFIF
jgi:hypothetical protein